MSSHSTGAVAEEHRVASNYAPAPASTGHFKWWVVFMLWFVCFLTYGDRQAIFAIFPRLSSIYGFDKFQLGLIGSAFMWVYAFGSPVAGYLGDRLKRKNLILGGCFVWSLATMATAWCTQLWQFITVRALTGAGETVYFPASMSLISDYHGPDTRSKAMSFHQSSVYAGSIMGSWITALIAERYQWQTGFYLFGGLGIVLALVLQIFLREPRRGQMDQARATEASEYAEAEAVGITPAEGAPPDHSSISTHPAPLNLRDTAIAIFSNPTAILLMLAFLGANFVAAIFMTWTPTFLYDKFHFGLASAGLSATVYIQVASAVGAPLGGILADRLSRRFSYGRVLVQAAGLLFGATFVFLIGNTNNVSTLLGSMICFGFGKGLYDSNIFASMYDVIDPRARSSAAGLMNTIGWSGGALGPLVIGWAAQHGSGTDVQNMSHAIAKTGLIYVVSAAFLLLVPLTASRVFRK